MKTLDQLQTNLEAIPEEMKRMKNWICFGTNQIKNENETFDEYSKRTGLKIPKNPNEDQRKRDDETWKEYGTRTSASNNDPTTWTTFEKAVEVARSFTGISGIGFELGTEEKKSGIIAIDLDDCLQDGKLSTQDQETIDFLKDFNELETYSEISLSKNGLHYFIKGTIPHTIAKHSKPEVEIYSFGRYIAMTGNKFQKNNELQDTKQRKLDQIFAKYDDKKENSYSSNGSLLDEIGKPKEDNDQMKQIFVEAIKQESDYLNTLFFERYRKETGLNKKERCLNCNDPEKHPHGDQNPSMTLNEDKYFCHSCKQPFGIVDFVKRDYNLETPREAIKKIKELYKGTPEIKEYYRFENEISKKIDLFKESLEKKEEVKQEQVQEENGLKEKYSQLIIEKQISNQMERFATITNDGTFEPIPSGIEKLDETMTGGFINSSIITIGGGTSTGKTTFTLQLLQNIAMTNPVLYFTLEMAEEQIIAKMISNFIYKKSLKRHSIQAQEILQSYKLDKEKKEVVDFYSKQFQDTFGSNFLVIYPEEPTIDEIIKFATQYQEITGKKPIIAIDYLQFLQGDVKEDSQSTIKRATKELKKFAIENKTIAFVLFANNREATKTKSATTISSGLGSSSIEYTSDYQFTLGFTEYEKDESTKPDENILKEKNPRRMTLTIQKNRLGMTGKQIDFLFYTKENYFELGTKARTNSTPVNFGK